MDAVKALSNLLRSRVLVVVGAAILANPSLLVLAKEPQIPSPESHPPSNGGTGDGIGKAFVVHAYPNTDLGDAIARVRRGGKLVLHAGRSQEGEFSTYRVPRRLEVQKSIAIIAAEGDEGHVQLVFGPSSRCFDLAPNLLAWRDRNADGTPDPPSAEDDSKASDRDMDADDGPDDVYAPPGQGVDEDMCRQPQPGDPDRFNPTPRNTVALCGLRIHREFVETSGTRRVPACISVWRRKLYMERTIVDAGNGSAIDVASSPLVRMGTAKPGGIDRSVLLEGQGDYGIRVDRKSKLLLEWTEIGGFGKGVWADGSVELKRGVQIHNNYVGLLISGGTDDSDIFGPRDISVGVDENVVEGSSEAHAKPLYWRPEIEDNETGILVDENFEGNVDILAAKITCGLRFPRWGDPSCIERGTGLRVGPSKFRTLVKAKHLEIIGLPTAISAAAPVHVGPDANLAGNRTGVEFDYPAGSRRTLMEPYTLTGDPFAFPAAQDSIDLKFTGYVDGALRLCNIKWPKKETIRNRETKKYDQFGGVYISAAPGAGFSKCYIDDVRKLRRNLWKSSEEAFKQVCKEPILSCSAPVTP